MAPFPVDSKAQDGTDLGEFNVKNASPHLGSMQLSWYEASCPYETSTRAGSNSGSNGTGAGSNSGFNGQRQDTSGSAGSNWTNGQQEDTSSGDDKNHVDASTEDEWMAGTDLSRQISTFSVPDAGFARLVTGESWPTYSIPDTSALETIPAMKATHGHSEALAPVHPCVTIPPRDDALGVLDMWEPMQPVAAPAEAGMMWPVVVSDWYADGMWESGETVSGEQSPVRPPRMCLNMWEAGENVIGEHSPMKQMCPNSPKSPTQTSSLKQDRNRRKSRSLISMAQKAQQKQNPRQQGRAPQQVDQNGDQTQWQPESSWSKGNWSQMSEAAAEGSMSVPASPVNRGDAPQQVQTVLCTSCGGEIMPHFKFCRFCGSPQSNPQFGAR
jgi:hypothetical protein